MLDHVLPHWHHRERHQRRVDAPPERVFAAIRELTLAEMPVGRALTRLRGIRSDANKPLFEEMRRLGFRVAAEEPDRELVFAAIGQPWKIRGGRRPPETDFRTFAEPGYAKMAMNFRLVGGTLTTETRVQLTDPASRRAFRRYWLVIRPLSGLIRRIWLRGIARRAGSAPEPVDRHEAEQA
jgi:hypothetical protein